MPFLGSLVRLFRHEQKSPSPPTTRRVEQVKQFTACTFCGTSEFYEGPSGGVSQNIKCAKCGARFNIGLIPDGPILLDVLSGPTEEPYAHPKP